MSTLEYQARMDGAMSFSHAVHQLFGMLDPDLLNSRFDGLQWDGVSWVCAIDEKGKETMTKDLDPIGTKGEIRFQTPPPKVSVHDDKSLSTPEMQQLAELRASLLKMTQRELIEWALDVRKALSAREADLNAMSVSYRGQADVIAQQDSDITERDVTIRKLLDEIMTTVPGGSDYERLRLEYESKVHDCETAQHKVTEAAKQLEAERSRVFFAEQATEELRKEGASTIRGLLNFLQIEPPTND
jgi:hypothetical protein